MGWWSNVVSGVFNAIVFTYDILFQTWGMRHLPRHIDDVGGPVEGLTAIVTGPTSGIGEETAAALARRGAKVVLACRSKQRGEDLCKALKAAAKLAGRPQPDVEVRILDLASLESVRKFAADWEAEKRPLHILINNAGVFTIGAPRSETKDGFELHMGSNHLGHFLLTLLLLPSLRRGVAELKAAAAAAAAATAADGGAATAAATAAAAASRCRIVCVSSSYHALAREGISVADPHLTRRGAYNSDLGYAQSKLANPWLAPGVFAVHPGLVCTAVARDLPWWMRVTYYAVMGRLLLNCMQGARASIYCAASPAAIAEATPTCGYLNSNCRAVNPAPAATDDAAALWLWRWSAQQVGLDPSLDLPEP
ncbi:hypothetical protein VOLCADRAFT_119590 [Volvox carteri f. nagariensis]|uniref:Uncharacterized protein n=1 Tax=Volvox carteri f. nagariensis TaxID=3068 RepID=D8UEP0_VOLCA|nr:uncharacterized protein VOLCADRAFT_119590 [Volvox carteri f. nagariensis]EFJ41801.1 hypothetical protein VOLCADRAFT_119590 [Volvox carteri f. nagariensis]|eukprot:XP_002957147.1 hypothetical protein VOLCADRAFT_119590 [Volvox carteri f. nagariensis]